MTFNRNTIEALAYPAVLLAALLACKGGSSSSGDSNTAPALSALPSVASSAAPSASDSASSNPLKGAIPVLARDLYAAYQANEVAADDKYKGKKLAVVGAMTAIEKD